DAVSEAVVRMARKAAALIDMSRHTGEHPRIGALDVCPIVPISGTTMEECIEVARTVGCRLADELQIPIYFYEHAATRDERRSLANIRTGEYEGLQEKLTDPVWAPDCGPAVFNARLGATVVGAREFLIAYNVNLNTRDRHLAHEIALNIREAGRLQRDENGNVVANTNGSPARTPGRLRATRAIGWYIEAYRQAQVSINLLDFRATPLHVVFETVNDEAERLGLRVTGSELVGMTPLQPLLDAGRFYLRKQGKSPGAPESELIDLAVRSLGLDQLAPFDPQKKIVEYGVRAPAPLMSLPLHRFVDEVSSNTPVPGGGSAAALAGSLGAALAAMVANLTVSRSSDDDELSEMSERAQATKQALAGIVDEDARAFSLVMDAMRMPRTTEVERHSRNQMLQAAYRGAAEVPLEAARLSLAALEFARVAARKGRGDAASDAGTAALLARAAVEGAVLNVLINLQTLEDQTFVRTCRNEVDRVRALARRICDEVVDKIQSGLEDREARS
ncbi:MAG TPA: glutamate formimidoyltransferase, partial [Vicinamibacterales bacterium]|nr:glutamate formimidoyltransferase [Vicinamibacterales bacterium]